MADAMLDKVREYAAEMEAQGKTPAYAFATAWARACKYHPELDTEEHCQRQGRQYLTLPKNQRLLRTLHRLCERLPRGGEVMFWSAMAMGVRTTAYVAVRGRQREVLLKYGRDLYAPGIAETGQLETIAAHAREADLGTAPPAAIATAVDGVVAAAGGVQNPSKPEQVAWMAQYPENHFLDEPQIRKTEVKTHFNLNTGGYSVEAWTRTPDGRGARWLVRENKVLEALMHNAIFQYKPAGHRHYVEPGEGNSRRNVHAYVCGTLSYDTDELSKTFERAKAAGPMPFELPGGWRLANYSKSPPCFMDTATKQCLPNDRSVDVFLTSVDNRDPATGKPRPSRYKGGKAVPWAPAMYWRPSMRRNPSYIAHADRLSGEAAERLARGPISIHSFKMEIYRPENTVKIKVHGDWPEWRSFSSAAYDVSGDPARWGKLNAGNSDDEEAVARRIFTALWAMPKAQDAYYELGKVPSVWGWPQVSDWRVSGKEAEFTIRDPHAFYDEDDEDDYYGNRRNPRTISRAGGALFDLPPTPRSVAAPPEGFEDFLVTDTSKGGDWVTHKRVTYYTVRSPQGRVGTLIPHDGVYQFHEQLDLFANPRRRNPEQLLTGDVRPMPDGGLGVLTYDVVGGRRRRVWVPAPPIPDWRRDLAKPPRLLHQPEGLRSSPLAKRKGNLTISEAVLPDGSRIDVAWEVVDLDDLVVSHDPFDLSVNKQYPQALQPRERSRKSYGDQISRLVAGFNPALLTWSATISDGAPILGPDNVVESGNGRAMALTRVYRAGGEAADAYRATVASWAKELGLPASKAKHPVLVRRRLTKVDRAEFARAANVSAMQLMSAGEQAAADAAQMPASLVLAILPEAGLGTLANAPFVEQFIAQVAGRAARGAMLDKGGKLSKGGQARIDLALFAFAYGPEAGVLINELAEVRESDLRTCLAGMLEGVLAVARVRAGIAGGLYQPTLDPSHGLVELALFIRSAKLAGQSIDERLRQRDLVGELSDLGRLWLKALRPKGRLSAASLADAIVAYCQWVTLYPVSQGGLFGDEPPSMMELVDRAVTTGGPAEGPA